MDGNMLNAYLPDWLNVILFPLFRHLPLTIGSGEQYPVSQAFSSEPHSSTHHSKPGHFFVNGIA
jgi:hypothetical protein